MTRLISVSAAALLAILLSGCSDPSDKVPKTSASDPTTSAPPAQSETASQTSASPQSATAPSQPGKAYVIRSESRIDFVGSKVTGKHDGGFKKFAGAINVDGGKIVGTPEIKIDMNSTWADNEKLTGHLKSADFFDAPKYPIAIFTVTSIEPAGSAQKVTGNLNLHGVTKSITFPANIQIADDAVTVKAAFAINRKQFNINYPGKPNDLIRDNVVLKLDLKATPGPARPEELLAN
jgi:polyisoprenoid-binding protein YceI